MGACATALRSDGLSCFPRQMENSAPAPMESGAGLFLLYGFYRAVKRPGMSVVLTVISLGTRVALAYALAGTLGEVGIWAAIPIGWALADLTGLGYYLLRRTKLLGGMEKTEI